VSRDEDLARLAGAIQATNTALVMLMGEVAILHGAGRPGGAAAALERMLRALAGAIPDALATIEAEVSPAVSPAVSAGFEEATETILRVARGALIFRGEA
jgi:hypothetical protein